MRCFLFFIPSFHPQVPRARVLPVCNFQNDTTLDVNKALLVLHILTKVIEVADDYKDAQRELQQPAEAEAEGTSLVSKLTSTLKFW